VGLSDRLGQRWGARPAEPAGQPEVPEQHPEPVTGRHASGSGERYRASARAIGDPVAEVRRRIHRSLLEVLGPKLYEDIGGDDDLARRVRETNARRPRSPAPTSRASRVR
jgi:pilus assembly protein CpaF